MALSNSSSASEWHTIRPWTPRIALVVREITSVSATFVLSSSYGTTTAQEGSTISALHLFQKSTDSDSSDSDEDVPRRRSTIAAALAKGLSVKINGTPWQRVLIRINDANGKPDPQRESDVDEAVVIIYGLVPGRQYDVDLALVEGEPGMRQTVVTEGV